MKLRPWQFLALLGGGVLLAAAIWTFVFQIASSADQDRDGPTLTLQGHTWETRILEGEDGHASFGIIAVLQAPAGVSPDALDIGTDLLWEACKGILENADAAMPASVSVDDINHIDLNISVKGRNGWPRDVSVVVSGGACEHSFWAEGMGDFPGKFSNHSDEDVFYSSIQMWGLGEPQASFKVSNGVRSIDLEIGYHDEIARNLDSIRSEALCIFAIATWTDDFRVLGIKVDPRKYPTMNVSIIRQNGSAFFSTKEYFGSARLELVDGTCRALEGNDE